MPTNKPERWEIQRAYDSEDTYDGAISAISALVNERWYLRGDASDAPPIIVTNLDPPKPAEWEYAPGDTAAPWEHDVDAFNREQRVRREAYAQGLEHGGYTVTSASNLAAKRYPLKKRKSRIIPDPHGAGEWRVHADGDGFEFREDSERVSWSAPENEDTALLWTPDRIRALAKLLGSPWAWVDDTTPEQESTP